MRDVLTVGGLSIIMKMCEIYIDGSSRGNPGEAGCAFVIFCDGEGPYKGFKYLGMKTNNEAEYYGLIEALKRAYEIGCKSLKIFTDSELLQKQMRGIYKVRAANLRVLYDEALRLLKNFECFEITHVKREFNELADSLAKAISKGGKNG